MKNDPTCVMARPTKNNFQNVTVVASKPSANHDRLDSSCGKRDWIGNRLASVHILQPSLSVSRELNRRRSQAFFARVSDRARLSPAGPQVTGTLGVE
jgi:hypothetical protein